MLPALLELREEAGQVGIAVVEGGACVGEPAGFAELGLVDGQRSGAREIEGVPEGDVGVSGGLAYGLGDAQEERRVVEEAGLDAEFFACFTRHRRTRVLSRLDVAACGQPALGIAVIDQQYVLSIDRHEVGDQVDRGRGGLRAAAQLRARVDPCQHASDAGALQLIERRERCDLRSYLTAERLAVGHAQNLCTAASCVQDTAMPSTIDAVVFDFGDTLAEYQGMTLNWSAHYERALLRVAEECALQLAPQQLGEATHVLTCYNTRSTPREHEVSAHVILAEVLDVWGAPSELAAAAVRAFFDYFRSSLTAYADAAPALHRLRARGIPIGVLTDVAYGMPRSFIEEDLERAGLLPLIDHFLTSLDVGLRKPSPRGLSLLAQRFGCRPEQVAFVGNEPKDVELALRAGAVPVMLDRASVAQERAGVKKIGSLEELDAALELGEERNFTA
ncbi:MAG: hypothetical protein JWN04_4440 [Myxococcaceae bacterium]|nr:hypothetical protein [Myxococcaceae bacterium]